MSVRTVVQRGPRGKKAVAFAVDWPGLSRGAATPELALELLESYRPRFRPVAMAAGLTTEFDAAGRVEVVEDAVGPGSTDFWGISFADMRRGPRGGRRDRDEIIGHTLRTERWDFAKRMRSWNLPFLIRHSAFHTMDHAWEMEDKDLT